MSRNFGIKRKATERENHMNNELRKSRPDEGEKIILVAVFIFAPLENESQHVAI